MRPARPPAANGVEGGDPDWPTDDVWLDVPSDDVPNDEAPHVDAADGDRPPAEGPPGGDNRAALMRRAQVHATALRDRAGDPGVTGYPTGLLLRADPRVAYQSGERAAVAVFYDDASRASDRAAAMLLPLFVSRRSGFDFVAVDVSAQAESSRSLNALRKDFGREAPTVVIFKPDRRVPPRVFRGARVARGDVELALEEAMRALPYRPQERPPAGTPEDEPTRPNRGTVDAHVQRLRRSAGDERVVGYPQAIVRGENPGRVLEPRPAAGRHRVLR